MKLWRFCAGFGSSRQPTAKGVSEMGIAAVPRYLGQDFSGAPPGHRFGLYFPYWRDTTWEADSNQKTAALKQIVGLDQYCQRQIKALRQRQATLAECCAPGILKIPAISTSPFMTGTGLEHPLENGFSFLNPYGLPYLPGSGVKGVLRRAAEELVSGDYSDPEGWNQDAIDALFGRETEAGDSETARNRGALMFWDVIPEPAGGKLAVDIMTPHYGDYYQGNTTPHDSGQPNPIPFLVIPPGSSFTFHVQCNPVLLPKTLRDSWPILLEAAFRHAFEWLGFGAKTAMGYGQFRSDALEKARTEREEAGRKRQEAAAKERAEVERQKKLAAMSPLDRAIEEIVAAAPQGQPRYKAILNALKQGRWSGDEARQAAEHIRNLMTQAGAWRVKSEKKKPEKDEPYQATVAVLAYLEGKKS